MDVNSAYDDIPVRPSPSALRVFLKCESTFRFVSQTVCLVGLVELIKVR